MTEELIRARITELRVKKDVSEYQMSLDLGQNKGYLQAISSGRAMPSMSQFIKICEYFEITPIEFFDAEINNPTLLRKATDGMKKLSDDDMLLMLGLISRLRKND
jgi:transcriptional regulator with XRE-family HTH domain